MIAFLIGTLAGALPAVAVVCYRLGYRQALRDIDWQDEQEAMDLRIRAACDGWDCTTTPALDFEAIEDSLNRAEWRRTLGVDDA